MSNPSNNEISFTRTPIVTNHIVSTVAEYQALETNETILSTDTMLVDSFTNLTIPNPRTNAEVRFTFQANGQPENRGSTHENLIRDDNLGFLERSTAADVTAGTAALASETTYHGLFLTSFYDTSRTSGVRVPRGTNYARINAADTFLGIILNYTGDEAGSTEINNNLQQLQDRFVMLWNAIPSGTENFMPVPSTFEGGGGNLQIRRHSTARINPSVPGGIIIERDNTAPAGTPLPVNDTFQRNVSDLATNQVDLTVTTDLTANTFYKRRSDNMAWHEVATITRTDDIEL